MPKGAYVIHLSLESFIAAVQVSDVGDEPIYVQETSKPRYVHQIQMGIESIITVTAADVGGTIHAARIMVEYADLIGREAETRQAMGERLVQALKLVRAALPGDQFREGVMLAPGLLDDLQRFKCSHDLWSWENTKDPVERRIVPSQPSTPPAA
jgi:hypothetical protein